MNRTNKAMAGSGKQHVGGPVARAKHGLRPNDKGTLCSRRLPQLHEGHEMHALVFRFVHNELDPLIVPPAKQGRAS